MDEDAERGMGARELGELVICRQRVARADRLAQQLGPRAQHVGKGVDDDTGLARGRRQRARHQPVLVDRDQRVCAFRHCLGQRAGRARLGVRHDVGKARRAQVDVEREQPIGLDRQLAVAVQAGEPVGAQPVRLGQRVRYAPDDLLAGEGQPERVGQPSAPSISSLTRRLNSTAYSIGSSFVKTSRKPCTTRF